MTRALALTLALSTLCPASALADVVTPSERVHSSVRVRQGAALHSPQVGSLRVGEQGDLLASTGGWPWWPGRGGPDCW